MARTLSCPHHNRALVFRIVFRRMKQLQKLAGVASLPAVCTRTGKYSGEIVESSSALGAKQK
jgi:hypothetical protein